MYLTVYFVSDPDIDYLNYSVFVWEISGDSWPPEIWCSLNNYLLQKRNFEGKDSSLENNEFPHQCGRTEEKAQIAKNRAKIAQEVVATRLFFYRKLNTRKRGNWNGLIFYLKLYRDHTGFYASLQRRTTNSQTNSHSFKTLNWIFLQWLSLPFKSEWW